MYVKMRKCENASKIKKVLKKKKRMKKDYTGSQVAFSHFLRYMSRSNNYNKTILIINKKVSSIKD